MRRPRGAIGLIACAALVTAVTGANAAGALGGGGSYTVKLVFPSAPDVVKGLKVQIHGFDAGRVTGLTPRDGHAIVTVSLHAPYAPLPQGTTAQIDWQSVLGERVVDITPGPGGAPKLPSGAMISGNDRVEIDQVLAALEPATRQQLSASLTALDSAVSGRGQDLNATLAQLGPLLNALGTVLGGVGADGPAIHDLVTQSSQVMSILKQHSDDIRSAIRHLDAQQSQMSGQDDALTQTLAELPATIRTASATLGQVPGAVDAAHPLLTELTRSVDQLPTFTAQLSPLLADLNPTLTRTRSALDNLADLLGLTPALLTQTTSLVPQLDSATGRLLPALQFLRPYTPEITGYFTNWASAGQQYLGNYHVGRIKVQGGATTAIGLNAPPPGVSADATPAPGSNVGQRWTDATGEKLR
jgi:phospholipid/cholesterol/gamma-HCH transport system substrate-binding protein